MPRVISLYTGAGGLDLGLERAGFDVAVAVEMERFACATIRANTRWPLIGDDIHDITSRTLSRVGAIKKGEATLLIGGPPCQPFSKSAYWARGDTKRLDDQRADTLSAYLRVLRDLCPRAYLLENVYGLAYKGKDEGLRLLEQVIKKINAEIGTNYSFQWKVLNSAHFGVPQFRERVFIVGSRDGRPFRFPEPTHCDPGEMQGDFFTQEPYRTAWDVIGDLADEPHPELAVGGRWGDLLPSIPEGKNYLYHTNRDKGLPLFGWRTRYWTFLLKLAKAKPSSTIQAQPGSAIGPFHWKSRKLSVQEMCRLQTIPDGYEICGGRTGVQRQLGNAVPSLMGEVLGREIRMQLLGERSFSSPPTLLPSRRDDCPRPERVHPVPKKYHHLIGEHDPHPGEGLGPKAVDIKNRPVPA